MRVEAVMISTIYLEMIFRVNTCMHKCNKSKIPACSWKFNLSSVYMFGEHTDHTLHTPPFFFTRIKTRGFILIFYFYFPLSEREREM